MVDIKVQHRINDTKSGDWPRCRDVTLQDGVLSCGLDFERKYALADAYKYDPHIQFANAQTDRDLIAFTRAWGPLFVNPETPGVMHLRLSHCRVLQQWFRALFDLLSAFKRAEGERESLLAFVQAESETLSGLAVEIETNSLSALRREFHITGDISDWLKGVDTRTVRAVTDRLIPELSIGPGRAHLVCRRERDQRYIVAGWTVSTLEDALRWMVWYDEFTQHPLVCCEECRSVFRAETAHARKYCSHECGHRATGREWQRNKRSRLRGQKTRKGRTGGK